MTVKNLKEHLNSTNQYDHLPLVIFMMDKDFTNFAFPNLLLDAVTFKDPNGEFMIGYMENAEEALKMNPNISIIKNEKIEGE
jgi:hypothetical protein